MRIAICLHGIHYINNQMMKVDYEYNLNNNKHFIFDDILNAGHTIDYFINTYDSIKLNKLLDTFKPVSKVIRDFNNEYYSLQNPKENHCINYNMIESYISNNNVIYDIIILMRFDLVFYTYFSKMNIDINIINIPFKHPYKNSVGSYNCEDNLFIFSPKYIYNLRSAVLSITGALHEINKYLEHSTINYMYDITLKDIEQETEFKYYCLSRSKNDIPPFISRMNGLNKYCNMMLTYNNLFLPETL